MMRSLSFVIGMSLIIAGSAQAQSGGDFEITRSTIDGGGGTSTGGDFVLRGTIGQPDAGEMSGGDFVIGGGFWPAPSGGVACTENIDCQDADPCIRAICDTGSGTCANHPRFYGDLNHDGLKNIVDVICEARVAFQNLTVCSGFQIDEAEIDYGPNDAGCGDSLINIVDVIITARIAFQNLDDECCGVSSALSCSEVTGGAPHCP